MSDQSKRIAEYLEGSCKSEHDAAAEFEVSDAVVLQAAIDHGLERCAVCDWWEEIAVMNEVNNGDLACPDCFDELPVGEEDA